ncbi:hypothetical protein GDO78_019190 [Eleutherodactylus coqui]|uniref:Uncharacterized protein n=1 Tax=Eleutherodactylus coqui TaxID=57060 RepID=A0A8J6ENJ6_ELECQ|nr:hypothetical protein GDO78_019190 [Eleutherodactylus coqui]
MKLDETFPSWRAGSSAWHSAMHHLALPSRGS